MPTSTTKSDHPTDSVNGGVKSALSIEKESITVPLRVVTVVVAWDAFKPILQ